MIVDLHNHAELSRNTTVGLDDYIRRAKRLQVALAITEHNRLYDRGGAIEGVLVVPGMEILNDYGDYLVFGAPQESVECRDIFALVDFVHRCGGVIIAAHPFSGYGVCRVTDSETAGRIIARMDAVEVLNGRASAEDCRKAERLAMTYNKPRVGGSDAHHAEGMFRAGTRFVHRIGNVSDLAREIRHGRCEPVIIDAAGLEDHSSPRRRASGGRRGQG